MSIVKKLGWRSALSNAIEANRGYPFAWGKHDCCVFVADCVLAMTGTDLGEDFRGAYSTEQGAKDLLKSIGFDDHVALAAHHFEEIHPAYARNGDIGVVLSGTGGFGLGIFATATVAVFGPQGIGSVPFDAAVRAFRVN